ncbi:helix-turn-helix domain-containing protein [Nonomuraea sp. NBC_00507]|uniref:DNA-binding protein n=1 Tax=Nonomuraea sp. NBC_00507 TaxID=2976002 RepID=UPI002E19EAA8
METLTVADLEHLPPTVDLMTAAKALGIGRTKAYALAKADNFPVHLIRVGDQYRVSTMDLIRILQGPRAAAEAPNPP